MNHTTGNLSCDVGRDSGPESADDIGLDYCGGAGMALVLRKRDSANADGDLPENDTKAVNVGVVVVALRGWVNDFGR